MKKLFFAVVAMAAMLTSCSKDDAFGGLSHGKVTFEVSTPELATRADYGDGTTATNLYYAVYDVTESESGTRVKTNYNDTTEDDVQLSNLKATVTIDLVEGRKYEVAFWAEYANSPYIFDTEKKTVSYKASNPLKANNETYDAFFAYVPEGDVKVGQVVNVTLKRPFAQLNVATNDTQKASALGVTVKQTGVKVYAYTSFDLKYGDVIGEKKELTFDMENVGDNPATTDIVEHTLGTITTNGSYNWLTMNYILVNERENIDVTFLFEDNKGKTDYTRPYAAVPVQRNYRTNVIGSILTDPTDFNVTIDPVVKDEYAALFGPNIENTIVLSGTQTYTLNGVNITTTSGPAIQLTEDANITLEIVGNVTLNGATDGIYVPAGASLTVTCLGTRASTESNLVVEGKSGSGIGAAGEAAGDITISDLTHITAKGNGDHAFGIGGNSSNVVITNSTVDYACGGHIQPLFVNDTKYGKSEPEGGAAIGGATIKIEGSTINKVDGGSKAAAIGAQFWQSTSIEIINSTIVEANGGNASAGIGGSRYGGEEKYNLSIVIKGSTVTATGGQYGAGIGSGYDTHCNGEKYSATNYIEIDKNSTITAKGGKYAAGIGTGFHSAYLSGGIAEGAPINAKAGEKFYKEEYTEAQDIGYGVVDPKREFSGDNANVTFTVNGGGVTHPNPAVTINGVGYGSFEAAIAATKAGDEVKLLNNVTLSEALTLPAGITFNGNGKQIDGTIYAGGNLAFAGHTKVTAFSASYYDHVITIGEGACLEVTGTGRVTLGYGNTFNVTGSISDAKTADKTNIQPSLIIPGGISITGSNDAIFNITNAYVKIGSTSSKNNAASGNFTLNIENSIAEFTNQLTFSEPTGGMDPKFNINVKNSVLTTGTKLCIAAPNTNMVVDNSTITLASYLRNSGVIELRNGSVLTGKTIQFGENGGNNGKITVDASSFTITAGSVGHAFDGKGTGSITLTNGAEANVDHFKDMVINVDATSTFTTVTEMPSVAKIGNNEYKFIGQAIANWTHNTTLTLMADVTLSDVVTLKSTEYRVLDLGTYTLTAAKGKDAISITAEGRTSASYALDIKADATNPGGINATSKAVVKTTGKSGVKDRPIIRFYNGIFNASNVISHSGSNGTNCPQFQFHGGVYNCNLSANRALIQIYGGTFNGRFYISVDSSAYALISGGKFKYLDNLYGSALNSDKFTIGSSKGNFDRGVYVDDEGYIVVGGAVITEFGDKFAAKATNASKAGSYLPYSSAATSGLYYTNADMAITKHGADNVELKN